jgi:hypothetical protein
MRHSAFESQNDLFNGDHAEPFHFGRCREQWNIGRRYSKYGCIKAIKRLLRNRGCYFGTDA